MQYDSESEDDYDEQEVYDKGEPSISLFDASQFDTVYDAIQYDTNKYGFSLFEVIKQVNSSIIQFYKYLKLIFILIAFSNMHI